MTKFFNVNNPSNIVTITLDHGNFYQLSDGNMIKKDTFESKYQPILEGFEHEIIQEKSQQIMNSDFIDPDLFLNTATTINTADLNKLKNINTNNLPEVNDFNRTTVVNKSSDDRKTSAPQNFNESLVTPIDSKNMVIPNNTKTDVSQYKVYENDDDAYNDFMNKTQNDVPTPQPQQTNNQTQLDEINILFEDEKMIYGVEEATKRKTKRMNRLYNIPEVEEVKQDVGIAKVVPPIKQEVPQMDPFTMMFSTFKRNHEVVFNIQFKDKIANPEFIKMMMENMDGDIVGFYKKKIVDNIMKNISIIEDVVENELKKIIGEDVKIEDEKEEKEIIQSEDKKKVTRTPKKTKTE